MLFAYTILLLDVSIVSIASDDSLQHSFKIQKGKAAYFRGFAFLTFFNNYNLNVLVCKTFWFRGTRL